MLKVWLLVCLAGVLLGCARADLGKPGTAVPEQASQSNTIVQNTGKPTDDSVKSAQSVSERPTKEDPKTNNVEQKTGKPTDNSDKSPQSVSERPTRQDPKTNNVEQKTSEPLELKNIVTRVMVNGVSVNSQGLPTGTDDTQAHALRTVVTWLGGQIQVDGPVLTITKSQQAYNRANLDYLKSGCEGEKNSNAPGVFCYMYSGAMKQAPPTYPVTVSQSLPPELASRNVVAKVRLNGTTLVDDVAPVVLQGKLVLLFSDLAISLGATAGWNPATEELEIWQDTVVATDPALVAARQAYSHFQATGDTRDALVALSAADYMSKKQ